MTVLNSQAVNKEITNSAFISRNKFASDGLYEASQSTLNGLAWPNNSLVHVYFNTTLNKLRVYNSSLFSWEDVSTPPQSVYVGTASGFTPSIGKQIYIDSAGLLKAGTCSVFAELSIGTITKVINLTTFEYAHSGLVTIPSHGFTLGQQYYQDAVIAGGVTTTPPTNLTHYNRPAFQVIDANTLFILNSYRPLKVQDITSVSVSIGSADAGKISKLGGDGKHNYTFSPLFPTITLLRSTNILFNGLSDGRVPFNSFTTTLGASSYFTISTTGTHLTCLKSCRVRFRWSSETLANYNSGIYLRSDRFIRRNAPGGINFCRDLTEYSATGTGPFYLPWDMFTIGEAYVGDFIDFHLQVFNATNTPTLFTGSAVIQIEGDL